MLGERPQQVGFRPHDPNLAVGNFDPLGQRAQMIPAIAAVGTAQAPPGCGGEGLQFGRSDRGVLRRLRPFGVGLGLLTDRPQFGNPSLQRRVIQGGDAVLDGVVEPPEASIGLGRPAT
ncbi:hypothetical protein [Phenylobacterium sp. 58.2.17]|uniref:hypothetical protein n=1 Tax=Phenylobacterium sp. 58.2.17 TaxID=2969306 RepID=UPI002264FE44|nr:hypothetical protein [Phenylobacterium sp. 58.2.17]MCX7587311.1 hypothetical protein [Phenylobacterium sp. 58.2.17]